MKVYLNLIRTATGPGNLSLWLPGGCGLCSASGVFISPSPGGS
ncbi:rCG31418 [Rattus norvegicus]|uniref:RCG31418 n=1 Tax=Rattus norvegicus TaxID=10116 RepID=A6ISE3_RAT|nr:rCG31418 [Rattus norvegicus]